ncbi:HDOD domain-containing protein [Vibrio parahaemolyticus]|uniref:HDOD domain-containing protein n=1 Tax=Vibrio parahaemolyticus TaxID=670 RepID=UPI001D55D74D|nr:HDOD domain-containing protein [Vibrio parahaemolyticus]EJG0632897.1 HDOD domain-containing protein [Vibrio parahaemolyticus]EJG0735972.1 HDOD domain-containing protein [Vibrio parahaemolyticus]EJG0914966.1 HDOD domain-containing protein [Vibrio parahaemolyticus]MCR9729553.1 HDOD domain-containing protein [Vibrio parahaemolyticus]MCR9754631.1 HDOD domain-containing protein [Vibrio parahaemolyticus]
MEHLSFFWLPNNKDKLIKALESEFAQLVEQSISTGKISLPPIPDVVIKIQKLCIEENTTVSDVANCLLEDPGLAAIVIRVANSVIFNRRNITCSDLTTAVSRLGIFRVRDIVTAQAIEQLKHAVNLSKECNDILLKSAAVSRELGATMVLVVQEFHKHEPSVYTHLELEKALLVGLLADIGLFCLINEYHLYLDSGNYLDPDIALQIFQTRCSATSKLVLERWGFDNDFREVSSNEKFVTARPEVSYLDIARIANHLLMFRNQDERIDEHEVEFNLTGAEVLYDLSNMSDTDFRNEINAVLSASGL